MTNSKKIAGKHTSGDTADGELLPVSETSPVDAEGAEVSRDPAVMADIADVSGNTLGLVDDLFSDFDDIHKRELEAQQKRLEVEAMSMAEKKAKYTKLKEELSRKLLNSQKALSEIEELRMEILDMAEMTGMEVPAALMQIVQKFLEVKEGIEKRAEAIAKAGKDRDQAEAELLNSPKIAGFLSEAFNKLKQFGLNISNKAIETATSKANEAYMQTEQYQSAVQAYPILGVRYETADEAALESLRESFLSRLENRFRQSVGNVDDYMDKIGEEKERLQKEQQALAARDKLDWKERNQLKDCEKRIAIIEQEILDNKVYSRFLAELLVNEIENVIKRGLAAKEYSEQQAKGLSQLLYDKLPSFINVQDGSSRGYHGEGVDKDIVVKTENGVSWPKIDLGDPQLDHKFTGLILMAYAKVLHLMSIYNMDRLELWEKYGYVQKYRSSHQDLTTDQKFYLDYENNMKACENSVLNSGDSAWTGYSGLYAHAFYAVETASHTTPDHYPHPLAINGGTLTLSYSSRLDESFYLKNNVSPDYLAEMVFLSPNCSKFNNETLSMGTHIRVSCHKNEEGIYFRDGNEEADVAAYQKLMEFKEKATREALAEEGIEGRKVIYTLASAMKEIERIQVEAAKGLQAAERLEKITKIVKDTLEQLGQRPDLVQNSPAMAKLKAVMEALLKEIE